MFALCGSNQTGQTALDASRVCSVADTSGFIAVFPSAVGNNWNLSSDVGFFSALIDTINSNYSVDLSRVYAGGMSLGGFMSHELGCKLPYRIAAIAPVAGTIQSSTISNCLSTAAPPVCYMHGTNDTRVSYNGVSQTLNFWNDRNQSNVSVDTIALPDIDTTDNSTVMKYMYRDETGVARVVFYKIINGGHTWPGMNHEYAHLGNTNMDINASQEIWNFVKDFSLDTSTTDINDISKNIPDHFKLFQNYPNPFNPITVISYQLSVGSQVTLKVYDVLGNEVATLVNEESAKGGAGSYEVKWNAEGFSSGVYFYQLKCGNFTETKKLILLR
jgi:polyhydroxybutyrate depolymerase